MQDLAQICSTPCTLSEHFVQPSYAAAYNHDLGQCSACCNYPDAQDNPSSFLRKAASKPSVRTCPAWRFCPLCHSNTANSDPALLTMRCSSITCFRACSCGILTQQCQFCLHMPPEPFLTWISSLHHLANARQARHVPSWLSCCDHAAKHIELLSHTHDQSHKTCLGIARGRPPQ